MGHGGRVQYCESILTSVGQEMESAESSQSGANAQQTSWPRLQTRRKMKNVEGGRGDSIKIRLPLGIAAHRSKK